MKQDANQGTSAAQADMPELGGFGTAGVHQGAGPSSNAPSGQVPVPAHLRLHGNPRVKTMGKGRSPDPAPWHRLVTRCGADIRKRFGPIDKATAERILRT